MQKVPTVGNNKEEIDREIRMDMYHTLCDVHHERNQKETERNPNKQGKKEKKREKKKKERKENKEKRAISPTGALRTIDASVQ